MKKSKTFIEFTYFNRFLEKGCPLRKLSSDWFTMLSGTWVLRLDGSNSFSTSGVGTLQLGRGSWKVECRIEKFPLYDVANRVGQFSVRNGNCRRNEADWWPFNPYLFPSRNRTVVPQSSIGTVHLTVTQRGRDWLDGSQLVSLYTGHYR